VAGDMVEFEAPEPELVENNRVRIFAWMGKFEFKAIEVEVKVKVGENALTNVGRKR